MPKICRWDGIIIEMFSPDHPPPHFHALYAEYEARVAIDILDVLTSDLPHRIPADVLGWARLRQPNCLRIGRYVETINRPTR